MNKNALVIFSIAVIYTLFMSGCESKEEKYKRLKVEAAELLKERQGGTYEAAKLTMTACDNQFTAYGEWPKSLAEMKLKSDYVVMDANSIYIAYDKSNYKDTSCLIFEMRGRSSDGVLSIQSGKSYNKKECELVSRSRVELKIGEDWKIGGGGVVF